MSVNRYIKTLSPQLQRFSSLQTAGKRQIKSDLFHSPHIPSTIPARMAATKPFFEAAKDRRTYYALSHESTIPDSRIQEIVKDAILHTPSAFNSQTTRAVVLLGEEHTKTWDLITEVYKQQLPEEKFNQANKRFPGFKAAYGTILFYEDTDTMRQFQEKFKTYQDKFPGWSEQTNGMHQYVSKSLETKFCCLRLPDG